MDTRFALKGTKPAYAPDRTFDTEHIRLDLHVDLLRQTLRGHCQTSLKAIASGVKTMAFDAVGFQIREVRWNGKRTGYSYKNGKVTISLKTPAKEGERALADIFYTVTKPPLGLYFLKPDRFYPDRPVQAWTQGEDEYARYWFPCHDAPHERTTTEVIATVPTGFVAVSNGRLFRTARDGKKKTATYHWKQEVPHAPYLVTLAVGRFSVMKDTWRKKPVLYYAEKGREADARRAFGKTPKMMEFFSQFIGVPYPYPKYAQVAVSDFIYGGMENTSATTQTDAALLDERVALDHSSDELVAHELAHQWFGDYLTCKEWSHAWLNESFATYFDVLFKRHDKGQDEFLYAIRNNSEAYFHEDKDRYRRPIATKTYRRPTDLFDRHLYEKGSVVLHMLHQLLGEDLFRKSIRTYVRKNAGRVVETTDLINAIEEATGRNMRRFFDQWVYGAGHPEFRIRWWWDARKKEAVLRVVQTQAQSAEGGLFAVDTEFAFFTRQGEKRETVHIDGKSHLFRFKLDSEPLLVLFDPDHAVLKRADFVKPEAMWMVQLTRDKNALGRIEAAYALAHSGSPEGLKSLRQALLKDSFWAVRAEAARALGSVRTEEAALYLIHSLDIIEHPKIRRAVYEALRGFKGRDIAGEVEKRFRKEASYFAESEGLRTLGGLRHPRLKPIYEEALKKDSWNDVIRSAILEGMAATRSKEWIPLLISYTKPGHHQRLRMAAIRCLTQLGAGLDEVQNRLLELTQDKFLLVQIAAVRALHDIGDERAIPTLKKLTTGHLDGRLKRLSEEAIEKITKGFE